MLLLRLLSTALCAAVAACVFALVYVVPRPHVHRSPVAAPRMRAIAELAAAHANRPPGGAPVNVIDVAPGVPPAQIAALIHLGPGEHVSAVNDRVPASDLEVGAAIASLPRQGEFVDLTVASPAGERRVLVLLH
jgi:S1-C subfamily serine protease